MQSLLFNSITCFVCQLYSHGALLEWTVIQTHCSRTVDKWATQNKRSCNLLTAIVECLSVNRPFLRTFAFPAATPAVLRLLNQSLLFVLKPSVSKILEIENRLMFSNQKLLSPIKLLICLLCVYTHFIVSGWFDWLENYFEKIP